MPTCFIYVRPDIHVVVGAKRAYGDTTIWQGEKLMDKRKAKRLQSAGWNAGSVKEFLGLSGEESAIIELKLELAGAVKERHSGACGELP
jgi:hypothetical protein